MELLKITQRVLDDLEENNQVTYIDGQPVASGVILKVKEGSLSQSMEAKFNSRIGFVKRIVKIRDCLGYACEGEKFISYDNMRMCNRCKNLEKEEDSYDSNGK